MAKLINILLRKTDPDYPWGFGLGAQPPALHSILITWVDEGSLAAEHLEPGDRVLEIEGIDTTILSNAEVEQLLNGSAQKLELLIMKKSKQAQRRNDPDAGTKTVKTKETVSSTTKEFEERKVLNEDLLRESKVVTTEGTVHKQVMETVEHTEKDEKTDTFWTCAPADLVKKETNKVEKDRAQTVKTNSGSNYVSESSIFKHLNNYRDEQRKIDPREEKRRFWENCHKDTVRKFKWGDSIRLNRNSSGMPRTNSKINVSTESLYNKMESHPVSIHKKERSKSCEPSDGCPSPNPFPRSLDDHKTKNEFHTTNPFYVEFEKYKKSTEVSSRSYDSSDAGATLLKKPNTPANNQTNFSNPDTKQCSTVVFNTAESDTQDVRTVRSKEIVEATTKQSSDTSSEIRPMRPSKALSKEEFETRCKFFEKATSVPFSCVNKNAREIVEERLKENPPTSGYYLTTSIPNEQMAPPERFTNNFSPVAPMAQAVTSVDSCTLAEESRSNKTNIPQSQFSESLPLPEETFLPLRKPSDFFSDQWKTNPHQQKQTNPSQMQDVIYAVPNVSGFPGDNQQFHYGQGLCKTPIDRQMKDSSTTPPRGMNDSSPRNTKLDQPYQNGADKFEPLHSPSHISKTVESDWCQDKPTAEWPSTLQPEQPNVPVIQAPNPRSKSAEYYTRGASPKLSESITTKEARIFKDVDRRFERYFEELDRHSLFDQMRSQRGGSLGRDFFESKTLRESSFEKVVRSSNSPYENVESASTKEYREESGPFKSFDARSRTPAGFYDNAFGEWERDIRAKSPLDISWKSFEDIRKRLGSLMGAKPISTTTNAGRQAQRIGLDNVEEAFHQLAVQEGIISSSSVHQNEA
ncbi:PDZ domain (Also known as DHR or GLGF) [Nesidiocoris tenuis]|uniref:PDZ domain (Also known as DHR or GLGF) n=1 Tax=Nesidiocoris tenuis TaxID=355587 RepID=A0ABN7A970_9HEMI|nr:PDZ domain (Also known as DHR or GLGF) [Nesidiocoris tenuis]